MNPNLKPLILDFKQVREELGDIIPYIYDEQERLNITEIVGIKLPFIDLDAKLLATLTKTRVRQEEDDEKTWLEQTTNTKVLGERDDYINSVIELTTKTLVKQEQDDERDPSDYQ